MTAIINNGWIIQTHIYAYVEFWKSEKNVKTVGATLIVIKPFHVFLSLSIELFATQDTVHRPLQIACHSFLTSLSLYISCHKLKNIAVIFLAIDRLRRSCTLESEGEWRSSGDMTTHSTRILENFWFETSVFWFEIFHIIFRYLFFNNNSLLSKILHIKYTMVCENIWILFKRGKKIIYIHLRFKFCRW